jgi:AGCS family alanine or glycine:cation symporter
MEGGPFVWLSKHKKGFLASMYAFFLAVAGLLTGCTTQSNALAQMVNELFNIPTYITGIVAVLITGLVILRGLKGIEKFCMFLVPFMGFFYLGGCIIFLVLNSVNVFPAITLIMKSAFSASSFVGGAIGYSLSKALRFGIARGLFTNEAGLGTASIIASSTDAEPHEQGLISMSATFWDTVVMCAITGVVIVAYLINTPLSLLTKSPGSLTLAAFSTLPFFGAEILTFATVCFAISTLIGWSYIGKCGAYYLWGQKKGKIYLYFYLAMIFVGALLSLELIWEVTDLVNVFLLLPSVYALVKLSSTS